MIDHAAESGGDFGGTVQGTPAPCRGGCPVGTDAAAYVALLAEGRVADAYDVARQHNPFASVCGRVCSAPCERACRRGVVDSPISIRALKRVLCDAHGAEQGDASRWMRAVGSIPPASGSSIGVIGSGPAGLAAAHDLRLAGHAVTVYESMDAAGGMMRYGIPAFRLVRDVLDAEIAAIASMGVDVQLRCAIGRDVSFAQLLERHAAVLLTVGCQQGRQLRAPGAELPGVMRAVDFLRKENVRFDEAAGEATIGDGAVVIIGGGSVAFDAARSAWRTQSMSAYDARTALDAARSARRASGNSVTLVAPEATSKLSVPPEELHEATTEGVSVRGGFGVVRILGDACVTGVEVAPVLSLFDADGRFNPQLDLDTRTVLACNTVVLAIGQQSDTDFLADTPSISRTPWGGVVVDKALRTTDPRVWAAGDVASGPRDLIDAIAAGQRAAASMIASLSGEGTVRPRPAPAVHTAPPMPRGTRFWSGYDDIRRVELPVLQPERRDAVAEVEHALHNAEGQIEAARCLRCDEHMQFSPRRCIACALCVDVCPQSSLSLIPTTGGVLAGGTLALLFDDDTCIRCGLCVHRCPTDALHFTLSPAQSRPVLPERGAIAAWSAPLTPNIDG